MNASTQSGAIQKLLRFGFEAVRCVVTVSVGACLILAWMLTSPLIRLGVWLGDLCRAVLPKMKG